MNIAILQPTPFKKGHYYIYTKSLLEEIKRSNHHVQVISATKQFISLEKERSMKLDFNIYTISGLFIYINLCLLTIFRFVFFKNKFNRIIILDCEYSCVSLLLIILRILNWKGKITIQVNAPNFSYEFKEYGFNIYKLLKYFQSIVFKYSLKLFDVKISCLGEWHKNKLSKQLKFKKRKIVIIEDGGGGKIKNFSSQQVNHELRNSLINYPVNNKKIFLLFGNMRKEKGHLFIAFIWAKYFSKIKDPYLWIIGHDEEGLSNNISKLNCKNIILHNSYVDLDIIKIVYQKSDYAILPYLSNYSGGSGPLMKGAFTHSKLAIVSNVSEMGRLAFEENLALFFEPQNEKSIVSCIKNILKVNPNKYSDKIKAANKYANERDWPSLSKKFIESFD